MDNIHLNRAVRWLSYGSRWMWFILVTFCWALILRLVMGITVIALVILVIPTAVAANLVGGEVMPLVVGVLALVANLIAIGAVGERLDRAYPTLSVDISFHSPEKGREINDKHETHQFTKDAAERSR